MEQSNINRLLQQNKYLKEVYNKAVEKLGKYADELSHNGDAYAICVDLLDLLNGVSHHNLEDILEIIDACAKQYDDNNEGVQTFGFDDLQLLNAYINKLKEENEEYELQNLNLRTDMIIKKMSFPNELIKDKTFLNLYELPSYEELSAENKNLQKKYNEALKILSEYQLPCEIDDFNMRDENIDYCSDNCSVDDELYPKCWDRYIQQKLKDVE